MGKRVRREAMTSALLAAGLALLLCTVSVFAAPSKWLLKAGPHWVSDRSFIMAISVKSDVAGEDRAKRAPAQLRRLRERLVLAAAAEREGLGADPAFRAAIESYYIKHLYDLYVGEKVVFPARTTGGVPEQPASREERERLMKELRASAAAAFPAEIDEAALAAAARGVGSGNAVVARVAGKQVLAAEITAAMAKVDHPSSGPGSDVLVARALLNPPLDRIRFAALAEREGFAKRPDLIDDLEDRAIRILAETYVAKKIAPKVQVEEKEIAEAYERDKELLRRGEEKEIFEILVPTQEEAAAIAARLAAGADFDAEVRERSQGPTREKGGFIGFVQAGELIPPLDAALRELKAGQVGPAVRSPAGYHILRCASVRSGWVPPLEEVRPMLEARLREARHGQALAESVSRLEAEIPVEFNEQRYQEILKSL